MILICKKETKRTLKGVRYEVNNLWNNGNNQRWIEGKVEIKNVGRFNVKNFTDLNGNPVPNINYTNPKSSKTGNTLKFKDIKVGDILVCQVDSYKTLIKGGMYKVTEKSIETGDSYGGFARDTFIRLLGVNRKLKFNPWKFRTLSAEEARDISLKSILDDKEPEIITTTKFRKIDVSANKDKELVEALCLSILDKNRHHLSIIDWACEKTGKKLGINKEDYKEILNLKLSDIIKILDNE
jgi:hypothetical protein